MTSDDLDLVDDMVNRVGNLCLLSRINRRLGNAGFSEKRAFYTDSELVLTKRVSDADSWNRETITSRQKEMAKLAVAVWRFD